MLKKAQIYFYLKEELFQTPVMDVRVKDISENDISYNIKLILNSEQMSEFNHFMEILPKGIPFDLKTVTIDDEKYEIRGSIYSEIHENLELFDCVRIN